MRSPIACALLVASLAGLAAAPPALAEQKRLVTIAARWCPSYTDITANRARNNIMESLQNLGADTPYGKNGIPLNVDPVIEAQVQPKCSAISNWQFTLGRGYETRAVPGVWGSLSKVTGEFSPTIVTRDRVPLRDEDGIPLGSTFIEGAETIKLTKEQSDLAATSSKLWIEGGTPTLPITDPETYAFGALRCATDNYNGDNVEWISYPPDTAHVFCFAYYVKPAPTSGTINVVKEVTLPSGTGPQKFRFTGDISYTNNEFFLTASNANPGRISFIRATGRAWTIREDPASLATLTDVACTSATGASTTLPDLANRRATVTLGAGDTVTCTFENAFRRPAAGLALRKISVGGIGRFDFSVDGEGEHVTGAVETTEPGVAARIAPIGPIEDLPSGTYDVTEDLPPDRGGDWSLERVACSPASGLVGAGATARIVVPDGPAIVCTFYNRFTPAGRITLRKITLGGTGSTRFQVRPERGETRPEREQLATTTAPGEPVEATGDDLSKLPVNRYSIQETIGGEDRWEVAGVECDGAPVPSTEGRIIVELTDADPAKDCTFVNRRQSDVDPPDPEPPAPPAPAPPPPVETGPQGGIAGAEAASARANLVVTKRALPRRVRLGGVVRAAVTVVNRGPDPAENVTVYEQESRIHRPLSLRTRDGVCRGREPRYCRLGTLQPGERAIVRVTTRMRRAGRFVNRVAVNTSTAQTSPRGKRARARFRVVAPLRPRFTG
jgi:Domain of unknown function DUF11